MARVLYVPNILGMGQDKYVRNMDYEGWTLYDYMTPKGFKVYQHYLISDGTTSYICQSFNNMCKDELLDAIDNYKATGKLGLKAMRRDSRLYCIHPTGNVAVQFYATL